MRMIWLGIILLPLVAGAQAKRRPVPVTTYRDAEHGVSLQYPSVWLAKPEPSYLGTAFATPDLQPKATFTFSPQGNLYGKTVLTGLTFSYFVTTAKSLDECVAHARAATSGGPAAKTVTIQGVEFTEVSGGSAGMCHEQAAQIDVTFRRDSCYAFERDINTRCIGTGDMARALTAAEQAALQRHLDAVMQSVRLR